MEIPVFGDNLVLASSAVGFVMPILIATISRVGWSPEAKGSVAFLSCVLAATLLVLTMGFINPQDWLRSALIIFTMAVAQWNLFYKPSGIGLVIQEATG